MARISTSSRRRAFEAKIKAAQRAAKGEERSATRNLEQEHRDLLEFTKRLLATVSIVGREDLDRVPHTLCGIAAMTLFAKIFGTCRAILTLCRSGSSLDAPTLTRSAVEAVITLGFITQEDCRQRASRWVKHSHIVKWKQLRANPDLEKDKQTTERMRQRAEALAKQYPRKEFWASGFGVPNLSVMAKRTGLEWYYNNVYWSGSQPTHSSAIAADEYLEVSSDKTPFVRMGLSTHLARYELPVACDVLIHSLRVINEAFGLQIDEVVADLTARYRATIASLVGPGEAPPV